MAKTTIKSKSKEVDPDETQAVKKPTGKRSFGDLFDAIPAGGGAFMPAGKWKAAIISFELQEQDLCQWDQ